MQRLNYTTQYSGKYLNNYGQDAVGGTDHVPPGWDDWFGLVGNSKFYNYTVSDNGESVWYNNSYEEDYFTDVLSDRVVDFVKDSANAKSGKPFFSIVATPAAHTNFAAAPKYVANERSERAKIRGIVLIDNSLHQQR